MNLLLTTLSYGTLLDARDALQKKIEDIQASLRVPFYTEKILQFQVIVTNNDGAERFAFVALVEIGPKEIGG